MPVLNEFIDLIDIDLDELLNNSISVTLNFTKEEKERIEKECNDYLNGENENIKSFHIHTIYEIIKKLNSSEQINFIKTHLDYIKENDEQVFLYDMIAPESLSYYFSYDVLLKIKELDNEIFQKMLNGNTDNFFKGFTHENYMEMLKNLKKDKLINKNILSNIIYNHNRLCYEKWITDNVKEILKTQEKYNKEFMLMLINNFNYIIEEYEGVDLFRFIDFIDDINLYKNFVAKYKDKISVYLKELNIEQLIMILNEYSSNQMLYIYDFYNEIFNNRDLDKIVMCLKHQVLYKLFFDGKLNDITLDKWIKINALNYYDLNNKLIEIIDTFDIVTIENLFDTKFYTDNLNMDTNTLKYVEMKYRNKIKINGKLNELDKSTICFSDNYLKNLHELNYLLKNNIITKNSEEYKKHLAIFIINLNNICNINDNEFNEIEKLFSKIVKGYSITSLYEIKSIEDIALINRVGNIEYDTKDFTVHQLKNYNVKHHRMLYEKYKLDKYNFRSYKKLLLKLLLLVGYNNALKILGIDDKITTLEHLVGNVNVKNIKVDNNGNSILNNKIINLLFNDKNRINYILHEKNNDFYKYLPRMFNEWDVIELNKKDKTLKEIVEYLKNDEVSFTPNYYRLDGLFKFIGCSEVIKNETFNLHNEILKRTNSSIPRILGKYKEYTFEVLKLTDMNGLTVGNKTDCCFTVKGVGYDCLHHAMTSTNGRILAIKKADELIAHSWLWRNGNLLCLDNIETAKSVKEVDFFELYLKFADEILNISNKIEGSKAIKNITIGKNNFDGKIIGIEKFPYLTSKQIDKDNNKITLNELPQPIESVNYSDSKKTQYLIRGTGELKLGYTNSIYQDDREDILTYDEATEENIELIEKRINSLRYLKSIEEGNTKLFKCINVNDYDKIYSGEDWYILNDEEYIENYINSLDVRAYPEFEHYKTLTNKKRVKKII